jgi:hypothetical protein
MNRISLFLILALSVPFPGFSQTFPTDPDSALFVTEDIDRFWEAYEKFWKDTAQNPFQEMYLDPGTEGVKGFIKYRIENAENLRRRVLERKEDYEKRRSISLRMKEMEKRCRAAFYAFKYWYPEARFPPVYFVIGAFNSGGTSSDKGLIIGAEMQARVENVPHIVSHELIHFQQIFPEDRPTLLHQSILEGGADFLGELISGDHINGETFDYGYAHKKDLCREFVQRMNGKDYTDWMYQVSGRDDRPNDLGYWMGYEITKAYFRKATDKKQAIQEILQMRDPKAFLRESGYLDEFLK